jgi:hypothetical protein
MAAYEAAVASKTFQSYSVVRHRPGAGVSGAPSREVIGEGIQRNFLLRCLADREHLVFAFALFGQLILNALQVTVQSFEFGGGILLMVIAIDMLGGAVRTKSVDMK